jgi:hypothetical protein
MSYRAFSLSGLQFSPYFAPPSWLIQAPAAARATALLNALPVALLNPFFTFLIPLGLEVCRSHRHALGCLSYTLQRLHQG